MSSDIHLGRQRKGDLREGTSVSAFAPCVPTVTLISLRDAEDKRTQRRLQHGNPDPRLMSNSHYRRSEGKSKRLFRDIPWQSVAWMSDGERRRGQGRSLSRSD